jgi:gamma-glutamylaminecyclotransferase
VIENEQTSEIHGEVYRVDDLTLERLDQLEGHPDWYERKEVEILSDNGENIISWLYFYPIKTGQLVKNGRYTQS